MADIIDQAQSNIDRLTQHPVRRPEGPSATGKCLNCEAALADQQRWCDHECYTDWKQRNRVWP